MKPTYQKLTYYTLDVFTDTPFGGNPLAVFTDAGDLSDQQMQRIAAELNLSETVFIRKQSGPQRWAIRIFMPKREIPFAGHPTVGTALLIKQLGWLDEITGCSSLVLEDVNAVSQASPDLSLWRARLGQAQVQDLCIYSVSKHTFDIRMRMFAPLAGIAEDPATGSAAAALVGALALRNEQSTNKGWMIEQGCEMGRPSLIGTNVKANTNGVVSVEVFGSAVLMSKGSFCLYNA